MNFLRSLNYDEVLRAEENDEVLFLSEQSWADGDFLSLEAYMKLPKKIKPDLRGSDLCNLKIIWNKWTPIRRYEFEQRFGHIAYLTSVSIDKNMLTAAIQFWDPSYRCFTFNNFDMTPLIEEYAAMLNLSAVPTKIYWHQSKTGHKKKLSAILGIQAHDLEKLEGVSWDFLHNFINGHPGDKWGMNAMALAIYGLVIFPRSMGYIDARVVNFFYQILEGINPVPTILAETFRSLNHCRREGKGRFIGCTQMLHVWILGHLKCKINNFKPISQEDRAPIVETCFSMWEIPVAKREWVQYFKNLNEEVISWVAPWMMDCAVIFKCGSYPWVPLLGLWGVVAYAPTLVRRQVYAKQFVPLTRGLNQLEFLYGEIHTNAKIENIVLAWESVGRIKPGLRTIATTERYIMWLKMRVRAFAIPHAELGKNNWNDSIKELEVKPEDPLITLIKEKEAQLQESKARNAVLVAVCEEKEKNVEMLTSKCVHLENECKDLQPYYFENHGRAMEQVNTLFHEADNISQRARRFAVEAKEKQSEVLEKYPDEQHLLNFLGDVHREFHYLGGYFKKYL